VCSSANLALAGGQGRVENFGLCRDFGQRLLNFTRAKATRTVTLLNSISLQVGRLYQIWRCECSQDIQDITKGKRTELSLSSEIPLFVAASGNRKVSDFLLSGS
jgi:hypothetical protein